MSLVDLLKNDYCSFYKAKWKDNYSVLAFNIDNMEFELDDVEHSPFVDAGEGCACFNNREAKRIEVVQYERFISQFGNGKVAGEGKRCDYILHDGETAFIFNELSRGRKEYLDGEPDRGNSKRDKARAQLMASINKLVQVDGIREYINSHPKRIALFSYRIKDFNTLGPIIGMSASMFTSSLKQHPLLLLEDIGDFQFIQQIYPQKFDL